MILHLLTILKYKTIVKRRFFPANCEMRLLSTVMVNRWSPRSGTEFRMMSGNKQSINDIRRIKFVTQRRLSGWGKYDDPNPLYYFITRAKVPLSIETTFL